MDKKCEWDKCENSTNKRFCRQACREKWKYHNDPVWRAKKLSRNKTYNSTHPEVLSRAQKKWYNNGGKAIRDAWRESNRDRYNTLIRSWRAANYDPVQNAVSGNRRRAMLKAGGTFTRDEWLRLCEKFNYVCANPKCSNSDLTVDHVVPLSNGGTNTINNIQPLCKSCNCRKGAKTIDYR